MHTIIVLFQSISISPFEYCTGAQMHSVLTVLTAVVFEQLLQYSTVLHCTAVLYCTVLYIVFCFRYCTVFIMLLSYSYYCIGFIQ